ncbi:MAG: hypothetical protein ACREP7_11380 [Lysobacter sp.]
MSTGAKTTVLMQGASGLYFSDKTVAKDVNDYLAKHDKALLAELVAPGKKLEASRNYPASLPKNPSEADLDKARGTMDRFSACIAGMIDERDAVARPKPGKSGTALAQAVLTAANLPGSPSNQAISRDAVEARLYAGHAPAHDPGQDAATLVASPMLARHPARGGTPGEIATFKALPAREQLEAISASNLQDLRNGVDGYQRRFATASENLRDYDELIGKACQKVDERYRGGLVTHATNGNISGSILPTADRHAIQDFSKSLTSDVSHSGKVTHTSETNTQHIATHDFVFFNVYPQTNDEMKRNLLSATRYLRETPEDANSPISPNAQSLTYGLKGFTGSSSERFTVMTLRDPVYPAGGTTSADAKKRMEGAGEFATYGGGEPAPGLARRRFGAEVDEYDTSRRLFVGRDAPEALTRNVQLGLYKTFYGLHAENEGRPRAADWHDTKEGRFFTQVKDMVDGPRLDKGESVQACAKRQDEATMAVLKMYQYPQLMVSGPVAVKDAVEVFRPTQGVAQQAPAVDQVAPTETQNQTTGAARQVRGAV